MLVKNERGDQLRRLVELAEDKAASNEPLTHALLIVRHAGKSLLVFNRYKHHWELAGGMLDPGETPRQCALRELREESGQLCPNDHLRFAGLMEFLLQPSRFNPVEHIEHGALYIADLPRVRPFVPNDEISKICWWDGAEDVGRIDAIDAWLARMP